MAHFTITYTIITGEAITLETPSAEVAAARFNALTTCPDNVSAETRLDRWITCLAAREYESAFEADGPYGTVTLWVRPATVPVARFDEAEWHAALNEDEED